MANPVNSTNFLFPMPGQGTDPWANEFYALINAMDVKMLTLAPPAGKTIKWGDTAVGHFLSMTQGGAGMLYAGSHDRQHLPFKNMTVESLGALPGAGISAAGRTVFFEKKLWVAEEVAGPTYIPVTRPTLVVGTSTSGAEYATIAAALTALPAAGGTLVLLPGSHIVSAQLVPPSNCDIVGTGKGVNVSYTGAGSMIYMEDKKDIRIANLTLTGAAAKNGIEIKATDDTSVMDITIENCTFSGWVDAIKLVKDGGNAFVMRRIRIRDCRFNGVSPDSASGLYSEAKPQDLWLQSCFFEGLGAVDAKHAVHIVGAASAQRVHLESLDFLDNGTNAGLEEHDLYVEDVDDLFISHVHSQTAGGNGIHLKTINRLTMSDCQVRQAAASAYVLDAVADGNIANCNASNTTADGWNATNCSKIRFSGCSSDTAGARGFELGAANGYLMFVNCSSRGSVGADLNVAVGTTNGRFGFVLSKVAVGTFHASNGELRTYYIAVEGWLPVVGAPALTELNALARAGWKMVSAAEGTIAGQWSVPHNIMLGTNIDMYVNYLGLVNSAGGNDDVSFELNVLGWEVAAAKADDAGSTLNVTNQAIVDDKIISRSAVMSVVPGTWGVADRLLALRVGRKGAEANTYPEDAYLIGLEARVLVTDIQVIA